MAFTDTLLAHSDRAVTIVDRRHAPGGHWVDAYPYVRLHQPSAFYGVDSVPLGHDTVDAVGLNAGYYELAGADEIRAHFARAMQSRFLRHRRRRGAAGGYDKLASQLTKARCEVLRALAIPPPR
jgi:cation diffusion facilitator CzcD-associated flavoprotein CzcO